MEKKKTQPRKSTLRKDSEIKNTKQTKGGEFSLKQPISVWNRNIQVSFGMLFDKLGGAVFNATSAISKNQLGELGLKDWFSTAKDLIGVAKSVKLEDQQPAEIAWQLVFVSISSATQDLVMEAVQTSLLNPPRSEKERSTLSEKIENELCDVIVELNSELLRSPRSCVLITKFREPLYDWLVAYGLPEARSRAAVGRLDSLFALKFRQEWRQNWAKYQILEPAGMTPADDDADRGRKWEEYVAFLENQVDGPMFAESFSLRQVYVPIRASWHIQENGSPKAKYLRNEGVSGTAKKKAVWTHIHLKDWVIHGKSNDALRVLSGGPGSGKSSFCKMFVAENAAELKGYGIATLFIQLHEFNPEGHFPDALMRYLQDNQEIAVDWNFLKDESIDTVFIVFDGLDELSESGQTGADIARKFIGHLNQQLHLQNSGSTCKLKVLLSGREIVIQAHRESELRQTSSLLELLPYVVSEEQIEEEFVDPDDVFTGDDSKDDQRNEWWEKYGVASGHGYTQLPEDLRGPNLEITREPLLNYLVALSKAGGFEFTRETSRNEIYEDLIRNVHKADYRESGQNPSGLNWEDFILVLEEIALAVWRNGGRKATLEQIIEHCGEVIPDHWLAQFEAKSDKGYQRLLTAFYFRKTGGRDESFEFTHKSFGEYLMARRIVTLMDDLIEQRKLRADSPRKGWDEPEALRQWETITGANHMDHYLFEFLVAQIACRYNSIDREVAIENQGVFAKLFVHAVVHGISIAGEFRQVLSRSNNAEQSLLGSLFGIHRVTGVLSPTDWPEKAREAFAVWFQRVQPLRSKLGVSMYVWSKEPRFEDLTPPGALSLDGIDLSRCVLVLQNFVKSSLRCANLDFANASGSMFNGADMRNISCVGATLTGANFNDAVLKNAKLDKANLFAANLTYISGSGASFKGAYLFSAKFTDARLAGANFEGAHMEGVTFERANLENARLGNAELVESDLREANLKGANLKGANLKDACMEGARLRKSQLTRSQIRVVKGSPNWMDDEEE